MVLARDTSFLGVQSLNDAFASGQLTPIDALNFYSARIAKYNSQLNAFLELRIEQAMLEAETSTERWRKGETLSKIDGIPFGVKANIAVADLVCHDGIGAYRHNVAPENAAIVDHLKGNGAIPLGTLNMHEGALGATSDNQFYGRCHNPWGENLTPGGSSGGSGSAVAAGLCAFALGTDTMGSVRIPSAYCGIAGHKPSVGLISDHGLLGLAPTLDHVGTHAHSAQDLSLIFSALFGDVNVENPSPLKIGVANWNDAVTTAPEVLAAFKQAREYFENLGESHAIDLSEIPFGALRRRGLLISEVEGHAIHKEHLQIDEEGFTEEFRELLQWGARQSDEKVENAYAEVRLAGEKFSSLFDEVDIIVMPTAPQLPFSFAATVPANQADFTCLANFAGVPSVAVPALGTGAPAASIQFIAPKGQDALVLSTAILFEQNRGAASRPPEFF